jgi:hypothetical protein
MPAVRHGPACPVVCAPAPVNVARLLAEAAAEAAATSAPRAVSIASANEWGRIKRIIPETVGRRLRYHASTKVMLHSALFLAAAFLSQDDDGIILSTI